MHITPSTETRLEVSRDKRTATPRRRFEQSRCHVSPIPFPCLWCILVYIYRRLQGSFTNIKVSKVQPQCLSCLFICSDFQMFRFRSLYVSVHATPVSVACIDYAGDSFLAVSLCHKLSFMQRKWKGLISDACSGCFILASVSSASLSACMLHALRSTYMRSLLISAALVCGLKEFPRKWTRK